MTFYLRRFPLPRSQSYRELFIEQTIVRKQAKAAKLREVIREDNKLLMPRHAALLRALETQRHEPGYAGIPRVAMAPKTLALTKSADFALSGADGRITPTQMQTLIDTIDARTGGLLGGGSFVRVTDPEFGGADTTGVVDSTTAFQNAAASGIVMVPVVQPDGVTRASYLVNNCITPNGATYLGFAGPGYVGGGVSSEPYMGPRIYSTNSAARIFNVSNKANILMEGIEISGNNSTVPNTCDGISAGSRSLLVRDCLIVGCRYGIGGYLAGDTQVYSAGSWTAYFWNNVLQSCVIGIYNMLDSLIVGGSLTNCGTAGAQFDYGASAWTNRTYVLGERVSNVGNVYEIITAGTSTVAPTGTSADSAPGGTAHWKYMFVLAGFGSSNIMGTRVEWNGRNGTSPSAPATVGYGLVIATEGIQVTGGMYDANGSAAILFGPNTFHAIVENIYFHRNGTNCSSGTTLIPESANVVFNGAYGVTVANTRGRTDTDGHAWGPCAWANFVGSAGNNGQLIITGNDMSGYQGSTAGATNLGGAGNNSDTLWRTGTPPVATGIAGMMLTNNFGTGSQAQDVDVRSATIPNSKFSSINVTTGTLAAGNITGAAIVTLLTTNATPGAQLMRSAANMYADLGGVPAGWSYTLRICNSGAGTFTLTVDAGATWTLTGTMTVATNTFRDFVITFTSATAGTVRSVGSGTYT